MRRERENGTGLRKGKKKEERGAMWLCCGFQNEGKKKRKKEEEKKIEVWVSKRVKKERFKKEEYKRERERETYLWIFELDTERALWLGGSSGVGSGTECLGVWLSVWFVCLCLFEWLWLKVQKYLKR